MKKVILCFVVGLFIVGTLPVTALAHGKHGHGHQAAQSYNSCNIDHCEAVGPHLHDDVWYCNQTGIDWNDYDTCTIDGCAEIGLHEHDDQWYHCSYYPKGEVQRGNGCRRSS